MKTVLVIGGTGYIGRNLLAKLIENGYSCLSISRNKPKTIIIGVSYFYIDITDQHAFYSLLMKLKFDCVVNCGGIVNHSGFNSIEHDRIEAEHFKCVVDLTRACAEKNISRLIQLGSCLEYGYAKSPQNETSREKPFSPYSFYKLNSTHYLNLFRRETMIPTTVIRLFQVYGRLQDKNRLIPSLIDTLKEDKLFYCRSGGLIRDFVYLNDVIDLILLVLKDESRCSPLIVNCGSGVGTSIENLVSNVFNRIQRGCIRIDSFVDNQPLRLVADIKRANEFYSWYPKVYIDEGLDLMLSGAGNGL